MAHAITTTTVPFGAITVHNVVSSLSAAVDEIRAWNERRRTVAILSQLDQRQLDDIGLMPADIEDIRNGARF